MHLLNYKRKLSKTIKLSKLPNFSCPLSSDGFSSTQRCCPSLFGWSSPRTGASQQLPMEDNENSETLALSAIQTHIFTHPEPQKTVTAQSCERLHLSSSALCLASRTSHLFNSRSNYTLWTRSTMAVSILGLLNFSVCGCLTMNVYKVDKAHCGSSFSEDCSAKISLTS